MGSLVVTDRYCDVRIWRPAIYCNEDNHPNSEYCWDKCRIGCLAPAKFKNPTYPDGRYGYAEWLCAECYDEVMSYCAWEERTGLEGIIEYYNDKHR